MNTLDKIRKLVSNFEQGIEPALLATHKGSYALVDNTGLVNIFGTASDAELFAYEKNYEEGDFCIQEIGATVKSMGFIEVDLATQ